MIAADMKISGVLNQFPFVREVLESAGVDTEADSSLTLAQAAEDIGFLPEALVKMVQERINAETPARDYSREEEMSTAELIKHVVQNYHLPELELLETIDRQIREILRDSYRDYGGPLTNVYSIFLTIKSVLVPHFADEEQMIFPQILAGACPSTETLGAEHEKTKSLIERLNGLLAFQIQGESGAKVQELLDNLAKLAQSTEPHMYIEDAILFKRKK